MIERAAAAHNAGLDFLSAYRTRPNYQNTLMLGRLLAEWGKAPAEYLFLLPLWHRVLVAEQIGTLAAITRGPFIMQCGLGWPKTTISRSRQPAKRESKSGGRLGNMGMPTTALLGFVCPPPAP